MLHIEALYAGYDGGTVLHHIGLDVAAGQIHAVAGANGAGKTTLLQTIAGLLRPTRGRILYDSKDITSLPTHRRVRAGIALVPQGRRIFATLTVAEHLAISTRNHSPPAGRRWDRNAVLELFPQLTARLRHRGGQLSGGEQQMLAIARALLTGPRVLLADEPTEGLAPTLADQVHDLLRLVADTGTAVVLTTPTPELAETADQVTILTAGHAITATDHTGRPDPHRLRAALTPSTAAPGTVTSTAPEAATPDVADHEPAWAELLQRSAVDAPTQP